MPSGEAEERHPDRQAHRDDRSERQQQDDDRGDQADQLAEPRSRAPRTRRTGRRPARSAAASPPAPSPTSALRLLEVARRSSSLEHRVLQRGSARPGRRARPCRCHGGSRPRAPRGIAGRQHVRQRRGRLDAGQRGPRSAESKNVAARRAGSTTTCAVRPALVGAGAPTAGRSPAASRAPGAANESSSFSAEGSRGARPRATDTTSQAPMTTHGRRAANRPNRYRTSTSMSPQLTPADADVVRRARQRRASGRRRLGRWAGLSSADRPRRASYFRPIRWRAGVLYAVAW